MARVGVKLKMMRDEGLEGSGRTCCWSAHCCRCSPRLPCTYTSRTAPCPAVSAAPHPLIPTRGRERERIRQDRRERSDAIQ
jgi:hypothetical protein